MRELNYQIGELSALNNLGGCLLRVGRPAEATRRLREAIDVADRMRSVAGIGELGRVSHFQTYQNTQALLQAALISQGQYAEALLAAEQGRAQVLLERLSRQIGAGLAERIAAPPPLAVDDLIRIATEHDAVVVEYSYLELWKTATEITRIELYIWVISKQGELSFRRVDLMPVLGQGSGSLERMVEHARSALGVPRRDLGAEQPTPADERELRQLHDLLIEPIRPLLPADPAERVIVVPHGPLFVIPFAALIGTDGSYLVERHTISTAPSIQILGLTHRLPRWGCSCRRGCPRGRRPDDAHAHLVDPNRRAPTIAAVPCPQRGNRGGEAVASRTADRRSSNEGRRPRRHAEQAHHPPGDARTARRC